MLNLAILGPVRRYTMACGEQRDQRTLHDQRIGFSFPSERCRHSAGFSKSQMLSDVIILSHMPYIEHPQILFWINVMLVLTIISQSTYRIRKKKGREEEAKKRKGEWDNNVRRQACGNFGCKYCIYDICMYVCMIVRRENKRKGEEPSFRWRSSIYRGSIYGAG